MLILQLEDEKMKHELGNKRQIEVERMHRELERADGRGEKSLGHD